MNTQHRPTGIERMGDKPWGTHFCLFYQTKQDLLDLLIPYFKAGLENQEYCLYIASEPVIAADAEHALRQAVPNFERHLAEGQIEIISHLHWYLTEGRFDPLRVRQGWIDKLDQALARGYAGMRFAANIFWLERQDWDRFADYERKLDDVFCQLRIMAMCAYALEHCSASDMLDVVHHHQFTLARRNGAWERLDGPELQQAHQAIQELNAGLERQVEQRTAQLVAANEQLTQEIAERQRSEAALSASEARLQAAIEAADIGLWDWDVVSGRVTWQGHQDELFGFAPGEFDGTDRGLAKHVHPEDLEELNRVARRARDTGSVFAHEYRVIWHDGSIHWIAARGRFVYDTTGRPMRMYGALRDVTERKQTEAALRESQQLMRLVVATLPVGVSVMDQAGDLVLVNDASQRIWGGVMASGRERWTQTKAFWHDSGKRIAPTDWASRRALSDGQTSLNELIDIETYDGQVKTIHNSAAPVRNADGLIVGAVTVNEDITERQRAVEAVQKSERVLRGAESLGHTGSWEHNLVTGEIFNTEENLRLFFGDDRSKGTPFDDYSQSVHPDDRAYVMQRHAQLLTEVGPSDIEFRVVWPDGSIHVLFGRAAVVRDESGQAIRTYGTNLDITERKLAEMEIKRQAARAETLARIAARLNQNLELEAVIHAVCEEAIDTFQVSQASMSLYDKKRDLLVYAGGVNIPPEYSATIEPITRTRFEEFIRKLGPVMVVPDIQAIPDMPNAEFSWHLDVRTVVTVAMLRDQELVGALAVGVNSHVREFTQDELTLLQAVSNQAAQAVANAQLFKAANEQREQLRALSARLAEAHEAERRAVARELHDEVGQVLTGLRLTLQMSSRQQTDAQRVSLDQAQELVGRLMDQIQDLSLALRPTMLDDLGLVPALLWHIERYQQQTSIQVEFDHRTADRRFAPEVETAAYRIVQEALTNVARHAGVQSVAVQLGIDDSTLSVQIEDTGAGFDVAAALSSMSASGLSGMRERAELLGGELTIESAPGAGTQITAELPLRGEGERGPDGPHDSAGG